jgi:hypothetical protein
MALQFSLTALVAAVMTTISCGAVYKLSAVACPRIWPLSYAKLKAPQQRDWDSRVPSTIHAIAITAATAYTLGMTSVFQSSRLDKAGDSIMLAHSDLTEAALGMSLGYFLTDIAVIVYHFPDMGGYDMIAHHIAATLSIWLAITSHQGHFYTLAMLATEVTTPFVNLRWHLDVAGLKSSRLYLLNGVAVFVIWLVGRLLWQLYIFQNLFQHRAEVPLLSAAAQVLVVGVPPALFSLNLWWFSKIVRGVLKLLHGQHPDMKATKAGPLAPKVHQQNGVTTRNSNLRNGDLRVDLADSRTRAKVA